MLLFLPALSISIHHTIANISPFKKLPMNFLSENSIIFHLTQNKTVYSFVLLGWKIFPEATFWPQLFPWPPSSSLPSNHIGSWAVLLTHFHELLPQGLGTCISICSWFPPKIFHALHLQLSYLCSNINVREAFLENLALK